MPKRIDIPQELAGRPFTTAEGRAVGLGRGFLAGPRVRRLFRGVYIAADVRPSFDMWIQAARLMLPYDAVVSHSSAMRLRGLTPQGRAALEFSTNSGLVTEHTGIVLHRRGGHLVPETVEGLPVTGPDRTFVDCAHRRPIVEVIQLGDLLVRTGQTTIDRLVGYASTRHLHGVRGARRLLRYVRQGAESPRETVVRLTIVWSGLPNQSATPPSTMPKGASSRAVTLCCADGSSWWSTTAGTTSATVISDSVTSFAVSDWRHRDGSSSSLPPATCGTRNLCPPVSMARSSAPATAGLLLA